MLQLRTPNVITQMHVEFLQACIFAEQYRYAERTLDHWPRPNPTTTVPHVLRYFYLRGQVHAANHHWTLAIRCFQTCLVVPAESAVSAIVVAAWKKWALAQCVAQRPRVGVPTMAPTCVQRFISTLASTTSTTSTTTTTSSTPWPQGLASRTKEDASSAVVHTVERAAPRSAEEQHESPVEESSSNRSSSSSTADILKVYVSLVRAFEAVDRAAFSKIVRDHERIFEQDGNLGLLQFCHTALLRRHVASLSSIYSVLPLTKLAELLQIEQAQVRRLLLQLSVDAAWPVEIRDDSFVVFSCPLPLADSNTNDDTAASSGVETTNTVLQLSSMMKSLDVTIASSSKYVALARKDSKNSNKNRDNASPARGVLEDLQA
jgi:hypothetical protein